MRLAFLAWKHLCNETVVYISGCVRQIRRAVFPERLGMSLFHVVQPTGSGVRKDGQPAEQAVPDSTRDQVLQLVMTRGPVTASELAKALGLTSAAIRRHILSLEADSLVEVHEAGHTGQRGRPARKYVASDRAQDARSGAYSDLALETMQFLSDTAGPGAVAKLAERHMAQVEARYAPMITADDVPERVEQLAEALSADGYAASARPMRAASGGAAIQLCQGHCPVQHVAARFPEFCEAEAQTISRLVGSHVQRLATLAGGAHVCTTNVPLQTEQNEKT